MGKSCNAEIQIVIEGLEATLKKPTAAIRKPRNLIINRPWKFFSIFDITFDKEGF